MYEKINLVYFSATGTTAKIVATIAEGTGIQATRHYKLLQLPQETISIPHEEVVVFGIPVYSGRVPEVAMEALRLFTGHNTPAIIVCVYGNRAFDDALLELKDTVQSQGFVVASAAAFVAQHSIFPAMGQGRPDAADLHAASAFGERSMKSIDCEGTLLPIVDLIVEGNNPYREAKHVPLVPHTSKKCDQCGACAKQCPTQAIDHANPRRSNGKRCIACAHCIAICPQHAKAFKGLFYTLVARKFTSTYTKRMEPYVAYVCGED